MMIGAGSLSQISRVICTYSSTVNSSPGGLFPLSVCFYDRFVDWNVCKCFTINVVAISYTSRGDWAIWPTDLPGVGPGCRSCHCQDKTAWCNASIVTCTIPIYIYSQSQSNDLNSPVRYLITSLPTPTPDHSPTNGQSLSMRKYITPSHSLDRLRSHLCPFAVGVVLGLWKEKR